MKVRPRGRPRSVEADEAILKAAWAVLAEGHYDRLTFEAVADRAGVSRPTLYRRFRSKVELVRALVEPYTAAPETVMDEDAPPRVALRSYLADYMGYLTGGGGAAIMALWQARRDDAEMSAMLDEIYDQGRKPYVAALRRISPHPGPDAAYHVLVDAMLGAIMFRTVHCLKTMAPADLELLVDQAVRGAEGL